MRKPGLVTLLVVSCALSFASVGCIDIERSPADTALGIDTDAADGTGDGGGNQTCKTASDCAGVLSLSTCQVAACNAGKCEVAVATDGDSCHPEGSPCMEGACIAGNCANTQVKDCSSADDGPCVVGVCDQIDGSCTPENAPAQGEGSDCAANSCQVASCDGQGTCVHQAYLAEAACTVVTPCGLGICSLEGQCVAQDCPCSVTSDCDDGLSCTADECLSGICENTPTGGACRIDGICRVAGETADDKCRHCDADISDSGWTPIVCGEVGNPCLANVCLDNQGCLDESYLDGQACDDGKTCTTESECLGGVCGDPEESCECTISSDCATAPGVEPLGPCQQYRCNPESSVCEIITDPALNDTACDAGACYGNDAVCQDGACVGGTPTLVCPDDGCIDLECAEDDAGVATCVIVQQQAVGALCVNNDPCSVNDQCNAVGDCVGSLLNCDFLDSDACTVGVCSAGTCVPAPASEGLACADGISCSTASCNNGVCTAAVSSCGCEASSDCAAGIPTCMAGTCSSGTCEFTVLDGGCFIGNQCYDQGDPHPSSACLICDGAAAPHAWTQLSCDDGNGCTDDSCDVALGCLNVNDDANTCSDNNSCSSDDHCEAGQCVGTCACVLDSDCVEPKPACGNWQCQNNECVVAPDSAQYGDPCDDGDFCTSNDVCSAAGCVGSGQTDCSESGNGVCLVGFCDSAAGACIAVQAAAGAFCNDLNDCTDNDMCNDGQCAGTPKDCSGLDTQCTSWSCSGGDCVKEELTTTCNDGVACTLGDTCQGGQCSGTWDTGNTECGCTNDADCEGTAPQCFIAFCDAGTCGMLAADEGVCDDGNPCTSGDTCSAGTCAGSSYTCEDSLGCETHTCDGLGGCDVVIGANACVIGEACIMDGAESPENECLVCDSEQDQEGWTDRSGSCDDSQACTHSDSCSGGACTGMPFTCSPDALECTTTDCVDGSSEPTCATTIDPGTCLIGGNCHEIDDPNPGNECQLCAPVQDNDGWSNRGGSCDDGVACTHSDNCQSGVCGGTSYQCVDGLPCTTDDRCDGLGDCLAPEVTVGCLIGETCLGEGVFNPLEECQQCVSSMSATDWTPVSLGVLCNDGLTCTDDDKCNGAGACVGSAACAALSCEDATCTGDDECTLTIEPNKCRIGGNCYAQGEVNPSNTCQVCDPSLPEEWSSTTGSCNDGNACTHSDTCVDGACEGTVFTCPDDGLSCTTAVCDGAGGCSVEVEAEKCLIGSACHDGGESPAGNDCQVCDPASPYAWSNKPNNSDCSGASCATNTCTAGSCNSVPNPGKCLIGDKCYNEGANPDGNMCQACVSGVSNTTFTSVDNGAVCGDDTDCLKAVCDEGTCEQVLAADFDSCDDAVGNTDWGAFCDAGVCKGFDSFEEDSHSQTEQPDRYERASRFLNGTVEEAYATWLALETCVAPPTLMGPPGPTDSGCTGQLNTDHFFESTSPTPGRKELEVAAVVKAPLGRHGVGLQGLAVGKFTYIQTGNVWNPWNYISPVHPLRQIGGGITATPQSDGQDASHVFFVEGDEVITCLGAGNSCMAGQSSVPVGSPGAFILLGGPKLVDTAPGGGGIRVLYPSSGSSALGNTWSIEASLLLSQTANALDATAANQSYVVVGTGGLIAAGTETLTPTLIGSITGFSNKAQTLFTGVTSYDGRFFAVGNATVTTGGAGSVQRFIYIAHAPTGPAVTNAGNWRVHTLLAITTPQLACSMGEECWVAGNLATGIVGTQWGLSLFGGRRAMEANDQDRIHWSWRP